MLSSSAVSTVAWPSPKLKGLQAVYQRVKDSFLTTHGHVNDWLGTKSIQLDDLRRRSHHLLAATSLAGAIAAQQPVDSQVQQHLEAMTSNNLKKFVSDITLEERQVVLDKLRAVVQQPPGHLPSDQELYVEQQLSDMLGFEVLAELDGQRLNHSIGIMGGEQHLRRFATDSLDQHDAYLESGIAPNRGAFGWFTEGGVLTETAVQREKYYFAVQTLYLPSWSSSHAQLKPWYQFRKMVVINPAEQLAVVGVVGDAGPAMWVQKQFGGSPEVIREGKIWSPQSRGRVLLFFVDDPLDQVPLGPISLAQDLAVGQSTQLSDITAPEAGISAEIEMPEDESEQLLTALDSSGKEPDDPS